MSQPGAGTQRVPAGSSSATSGRPAPSTTTTGSSAGVAQRPHAAGHQGLAVELDGRLGPTHPPAAAGGEQETGGGTQRLISVTGCS